MTFLKSLYTVAIALLVVAFVGFGISAFYPSPEFPEPPAQLQFVGQNQTDEETKLITEQQRKKEAFQQSFSDYNLVVSSISIGGAVLLLVASLLWMRVLPVIGDGATLGRSSRCPGVHDRQRAVPLRGGGGGARDRGRPSLPEVYTLLERRAHPTRRHRRGGSCSTVDGG